MTESGFSRRSRIARFCLAAVVGATLSYGTAAVAQEADLSVTKTDDVDPVLANSDVVYTITVSNDGPDAAQDVVVNDVVSTGAGAIATIGCLQNFAR